MTVLGGTMTETCACGCGQATTIAEKNTYRRGVLIYAKGEHRKYVYGHRRTEPVPLEDRIWKHVDKDGPNGCWLWTGAVFANGPGAGYGWARDDRRRSRAAHLVVWTLLRGDVPGGLELDHLCRNRQCCDPGHLEPVTHAENMRRSGMLVTGRCRKRKHEVTAADVYVSPNGRTMCRLCMQARGAA